MHVLAARLWSRLERMTLAQILATDPKYIQDDEVGVRLIALPKFDGEGHVTDFAIRLSAGRDEDLVTGGPWILTLPVTSHPSRFSLNLMHRLESRWLDAEMRLRLGAGLRELGHLGDGELIAIRDSLSSMGDFDGQLPYCRYAWILGQLVEREFHFRREVPLTGHDRMCFVHSCRALRAEITTELDQAKAWSARRRSLHSPVLGGGSIMPPGDARILAEYRAARAAELARKAAEAAKRELRAGAGPATRQRRCRPGPA